MYVPLTMAFSNFIIYIYMHTYNEISAGEWLFSWARFISEPGTSNTRALHVCFLSSLFFAPGIMWNTAGTVRLENAQGAQRFARTLQHVK